jgi:hypothetical protein
MVTDLLTLKGGVTALDKYFGRSKKIIYHYSE